MAPTLSCPRLALALAFVCILALVHPADGKCSGSASECATGGHCIHKFNICDGSRHCSDGSDESPEICKNWPPKHGSCSHGFSGANNYYFGGGCRHIYEVCTNSGWSSSLDPRVCKIVLGPILKPPQEGMNMSIEVVALLSSAVNSTLEQRKPDCPMLYTRVGKDCLSFFSPAKVPWAEARHFCRSIYGDLWHVTDLVSYEVFLDFMREEEFTSDYWIGGRFDLDVNAWSWTADDSTMPLGAPYWALKEASTCVPRGLPHTNPYSDPPAALPGARCYKVELSPKKRSAGWFEHHGANTILSLADPRPCHRPRLPPPGRPVLPPSHCQTFCGRCSSSRSGCTTGGQCINKYNICDGSRHCSDGSDESPEICKTAYLAEAVCGGLIRRDFLGLRGRLGA